LGTVWFFLTLLSHKTTAEFFGRGVEAITTEVIILGVIGVVALAGCIVSWGRERPAGIMLLSSAVAMGVYFGVSGVRDYVTVWSLLGLLYLIAGVLFLNSWRLSRKLP